MEELKRDLAAGKILPVYVVTGAEELLKREAVTLISHAVLGNSPREFNETRLVWKESSADEVSGACRTYPMLGGRRLVVLSGVDAIAAADSKALVDYLEDPSPVTTLLMVGETANTRIKLFQLAKKIGWLGKLDAPYANRLPAWIGGRAREKGARIDGDAAALLADIVGNRLSALDEALERLILYVAEPGAAMHIRQVDVEACIARTRVHTVFELTDALGRRRVGDALRILEAMLAAREAPVRILAMVARHFRRLWTAREALDRGDSKDDVARNLNVHGFFLDDFLRQARLFDHSDYASLLERVYQTDRLLKSSRAPDEMHMRNLVLEICL